MACSGEARVGGRAPEHRRRNTLGRVARAALDHEKLWRDWDRLQALSVLSKKQIVRVAHLVHCGGDRSVHFGPLLAEPTVLVALHHRAALPDTGGAILEACDSRSPVIHLPHPES